MHEAPGDNILCMIYAIKIMLNVVLDENMEETRRNSMEA